MSQLIFCLKPKMFPIINGNEGIRTVLYEKLVFSIKEPLELSIYIDNAKAIRDLRNNCFSEEF